MNEQRFAKRLRSLQGNVIRDVLKLTQQPDIISFAGGLPAPDLFPAQELAEIAREVLQGDKSVLQYGTTEGYGPLREFVADWVKDVGVTAKAEDVIITSGSQQGIDLMAKAMLDPGEKVVVESPTYLAAIQILRTYEAGFTVVHHDHAGVVVDELEAVIAREKPKLVYLVPTFQNPTGTTLSPDRRRAIGEILSRHEVILIEDDPYGRLNYTGQVLPTIKSFDISGQVAYFGSFSKIISPGLRVGFVIAAAPLLRKLVIGKQGADIHTSNLSQAIIYEFCRRGLLEPHVARLALNYSRKLKVMQECLTLLPADIKWTEPQGGLFIWGELPSDIDAVKLLEVAVREKVAFIPGESFFVEGGGKNTLRLNFSNATEDNIRLGFSRLAKALAEYN